MPIQGRFYPAQEIAKLLGVGKQRVSNLARKQNWEAIIPGLYYAQSVEWYLMSRGIDPVCLPVKEWDSESDTPAPGPDAG